MDHATSVTPHDLQGQRNESLALIRSTSVYGAETSGRSWPVLLMAWIVSGGVHFVLLSLFLLVTVTTSNANVSLETAIIQTGIDDDTKAKEANLTNDDVGGLDP